jgi:hypothetical protein
MKMAKASKPALMQQFEHMLWVNSPKDWVLKSTYFQGTLFISMLIETSIEGEYQKIRRSFGLDVVNSRASDLWGLAADCIDEMKTEVKS